MKNTKFDKYKPEDILGKKILIIGPNKSKKGGVATHIQNIISYLPLKNAEIFDTGSRGTTLKTDKSNFFYIFKSLFKLRKEVAEKNPIILINSSIYHSSFLKLLLILFFLPNKDRRKIIVFFHGGRFNQTFSFLSFIAITFQPLLKTVQTFHFLSEEQKRGFMDKMGDYPVSLFNNYSDSDSLLENKTLEGKCFNFLFVGRLVREKGIYELFEAVKILIKKGCSDFHFYIVGDGNEFLNIKTKLEVDRLNDFISLPGYLEGKELEDMYQLADYFVLPSYHEGFPYVFIEAMRAGVPFVTTETGALTRLVREGENGYFVSLRNDKELASILEKVIKIRPDMKKNCYNFFTENLSKEKGEEFYEKLLAQK